jgi:phosphoribosylformylglycinamidine synthase subunit PurQ / glutaminase
MQPRVLILRAPGINCDAETAFAFERAGGKADVLHVERLLESPKVVADYQILCIPGGFSYGDDISSGRILGMQFQHHLADAMQEFKAAGKLILGICNGFQVLVKSGLLIEDDPQHGPPVTLAWNTSGKYEDRWVNVAIDGTKSVFLAGIERMYLPIAHGEGQFVARTPEVLKSLAEQQQLALRYAPLGKTADGAKKPNIDAPLAYPENPNGAQANVAGMCDATGRVFGLMPHPERHIERTQHPRWTRGEGADPGDGLRIFVNAIAYYR